MCIRDRPDATAPDATAPDATAPQLCPGLLDCNDGIDADEDGTLDEDGAQCIAPPSFSCSPVEATIGTPLTFTLAAVDDGTIQCRSLTVTASPAGARVEISRGDTDTPTVLVDRVGDYILHAVVVDDTHASTGCELPLVARLPYGCERGWPFPAGAFAITATRTICLGSELGTCNPTCSTTTVSETLLIRLDPSGELTAEIPALLGPNSWHANQLIPQSDDGQTQTLHSTFVTCPSSFTLPNEQLTLNVSRDGSVHIFGFCYESAPGGGCGSASISARGHFRCVADDAVCVGGQAVVCGSAGEILATEGCFGAACP